MLVPRRRNNNQGMLRMGSAGYGSRHGDRFASSRMGVNDGRGLPPNAPFLRGPRPQGFIDMLSSIYGRGAEYPASRFGSSHMRESLPPLRRRPGARDRMAGFGADPRGEGGIGPILQGGISQRDMLEQLESLLTPPNNQPIRRGRLDPLPLDPGRLPLRPPRRARLPVPPSHLMHGMTCPPPAMVIYDDYEPADDWDELILIQTLQEQYAGDLRTQEMIDNVLAIYGINAQDLPDEYIWYP